MARKKKIEESQVAIEEIDDQPVEPVVNSDEKKKKTMVTRLISAAIGLTVVVPVIFLGDWFYFGFLTVALAIACWEILGCAHKRTWVIFVLYFSIVALITYWPLFRDLIINDGFLTSLKPDYFFKKIYLSVLVVIICIFIMFFFSVVYKDFTVHDAAFLITMAVLIGLGFQCLFYLRYIPITMFNIQSTETFVFTVDNTVKTSLLILFIFLSTFMTDAGAYFVGVFFGKNKINERISPKKTWEGFVGGVVISFIISFSVGMIFAFNNYPILPGLDKNHWWYILVLSLIIPVFATLGDFVFSSIKRHWGIKDYGKLIPGHGGILDRLDSIFFSAIVASIFVFMLYTAGTTGVIDWSSFLV